MMKLVEKSWGQEEWLVNKTYCGKKMYLTGGESCSWHYHKNKDETFYIEDGSLVLRYMTLRERQKLLSEGYTEEEIYRISSYKIMGPGDIFHVPAGLIHRFEGVLDTVFFEFSTHHEDTDTYRISLVKASSGVCKC